LKLEQNPNTHKVGVTQFGFADSVFNYTAPIGAWTHLTFVGLSNQTQLYVNGALTDSLSVTTRLCRAYIGALFIGGRFVDYMNGSLDEILLFNRALSQPEINGIYAAGSASLIRAPQFLSINGPSNNQYLLTIEGQTGKNFTLYSSTNLSAWTNLGSVANPTGVVQYFDPATPGTRKFYRATQP
jgi:hypothetical protein